MDAELFRRYPGDSGLRGLAQAPRAGRWQTAVDAGEFMARHGMERREIELIAAAFVEGREAVEEMLKGHITHPVRALDGDRAADDVRV